MFIQTNIYAMQALRYNQMNYTKMHKLMEQLSTGTRINRAADDAAGLSISESMKFQINGYRQATRNISDGIALIQTAEGVLDSVHSIIQRMGVLANQASNGIFSDKDREKMALEFNELKAEINHIKTGAKFNYIPLMDGEFSLSNSDGLSIQAGYEAHDVIKVDMPDLTSLSTDLDDLNLDSIENSSEAISSLKEMVDTISSARATLGASQNRLEYRSNYLHNTIENLSSALSRIVDTDYAAAMTEFVRMRILLDTSTAMLAQANSLPRMLLKLLEK